MDEEHEEKVKCIRILWSVCKFFTFPYYYWIKNTDSRSVEKKATSIVAYIKLRTL